MRLQLNLTVKALQYLLLEQSYKQDPYSPFCKYKELSRNDRCGHGLKLSRLLYLYLLFLKHLNKETSQNFLPLLDLFRNQEESLSLEFARASMNDQLVFLLQDKLILPINPFFQDSNLCIFSFQYHSGVYAYRCCSHTKQNGFFLLFLKELREIFELLEAKMLIFLYQKEL